MSREETQFLIINTPALWKEGKEEKKQEIEKDQTAINDKGLSLAVETSYINAGVIPIDLYPVDFAIDRCGVFYLLVTVSDLQQIIILNKDNGRYRKIECLVLSGATGIAISNSDILMAAGDKLICFARVNYQVRWVKSSNEIRSGMRADKAAFCADDIFILDKSENKIIRWAIMPETEAVEIDLKDKNGNSCNITNIINITSDNVHLYVLYKKEKTYGVLKVRASGIEDITPPLPEEKDFKPEIIAVHNNSLYISDKKQIVVISPEHRFCPSGIYITKIFDSTVAGCRWHKVVLDSELPQNTRIELSFSASDYYNALSSETDDLSWSGLLINPSDALLLQAKGQYIRFRIILFSDDLRRFSPQINSLKVEFPHHSYLSYLPVVYQEDEAGREFLSRFLPLFETFFSDIEEKIFSSVKHTDAEAAPDEFLPWLAQWLALSRDENWPPGKLRKLITEAPRLYRMRGTREGIEKIIKLYIDEDEQSVIIIENFLMKRCLEDAKATVRPEDVLYGSNPYSFCILLKPFGITSNQLQTVQRIVNTEKPAHTAGHVRKLEPWIYLDGYTYLGVNTILTEPVFILGKSALSRDTVLSDREQSGQIDVRARIGSDTKLT